MLVFESSEAPGKARLNAGGACGAGGGTLERKDGGGAGNCIVPDVIRVFAVQAPEATERPICCGWYGPVIALAGRYRQTTTELGTEPNILVHPVILVAQPTSTDPFHTTWEK